MKISPGIWFTYGSFLFKVSINGLAGIHLARGLPAFPDPASGAELPWSTLHVQTPSREALTNGGFPNKPMGFPTKNDHFEVWNGETHHLKKQPYMLPSLYQVFIQG